MFNRLSTRLIYQFKMSVSLDHGVSLPFILLPALRATIQAKNNVRNTPASSTLAELILSFKVPRTHVPTYQQM